MIATQVKGIPGGGRAAAAERHSEKNWTKFAVPPPPMKQLPAKENNLRKQQQQQKSTVLISNSMQESSSSLSELQGTPGSKCCRSVDVVGSNSSSSSSTSLEVCMYVCVGDPHESCSSAAIILHRSEVFLCPQTARNHDTMWLCVFGWVLCSTTHVEQLSDWEGLCNRCKSFIKLSSVQKQKEEEKFTLEAWWWWSRVFFFFYSSCGKALFHCQLLFLPTSITNPRGTTTKTTTPSPEKTHLENLPGSSKTQTFDTGVQSDQKAEVRLSSLIVSPTLMIEKIPR